MSRVAIYARVSTADQTTKQQLDALKAWAARSGHEVVKVFQDHGISGAKGREKRPQFDAMLKAATRREFDVLAVWSSDRLGRSMSHLVEVLETISGTGRGLYIHTQALDTTTPSGRALFGMLAVFGEFEREMIKERVKAGVARAQQHGTRSGKAIGRPAHKAATVHALRSALLSGASVRDAAEAAKVSRGTAGSVRILLVAEGALAA